MRVDRLSRTRADVFRDLRPVFPKEFYSLNEFLMLRIRPVSVALAADQIDFALVFALRFQLAAPLLHQRVFFIFGSELRTCIEHHLMIESLVRGGFLSLLLLPRHHNLSNKRVISSNAAGHLVVIVERHCVAAADGGLQ